MIVVTGATGHVGGQLVAQLAARDEAVRAMTRRPDAMAPVPGVEVVYGDAGDPGSLDTAFAGADRAFLMSAQPAGSQPEPSHVIALAEAARRAGVRHVVLLSVLGGGAAQGGRLGEWHTASEAAVTGSGMEWTLLRPGRFFSNAAHWAPMIRRGDTVHVPFSQRPAASIDPYDIAAVAAEAFTSPGHTGARYELSGQELLTPVQEVEILAGVLGRALRVEEPPLEMFRAGMLRAGMSPDIVDAVIERSAAHDSHGTEILPTVPRILGRPATTFTEWVNAHLDLFTDPD